MRIVQFFEGSHQRIGIELKETNSIIDVTSIDPSIPVDSIKFLQKGQIALDKTLRVLESGKGILQKQNVRLCAPITNCDKVICVGMNYKDHCEEQGAPVPEVPILFNKFSSSIIGPYDDIIYPEVTNSLDWEVELAIVVGKTGKNIKESEAMDYVFGYTVAHDVSARDWQLEKNGGQWFLGKTMDTFCPIGPVIVTTDELKDPHNLGIRCRVNGVVKQDSNTRQIVHKTTVLIVFLSRFMTLRPGDLILTGTPPGVGVFRKPPEFLKRGDIVECEIDGIGTIKNKVV